MSAHHLVDPDGNPGEIYCHVNTGVVEYYRCTHRSNNKCNSFHANMLE